MTAIVEHHEPGPWPLPNDEPGRLAALHGYEILDLPPAADLESAARLAAFVCGVPTAIINLLDADRQVPAAAHGCAPGVVGRESAMCAHVVTSTDVVYCPDASLDPRFRDNPFVVGPIGSVRFYAAAPLVAPTGHVVGTVCAFDTVAHELSGAQLELLRDVAEQVVARLEVRRLAGALVRTAATDVLTGLANRRTVEHALAKAVARAERGLGSPSVAVVDVSSGGQVADLVLRAVADRLTRTARAVDTLARLDGDRFVVLLEHTGRPGALAAVRRIRAAIEALGDDLACGPVPVAIGIATYQPGDGVAGLLARADAAVSAEMATG
jgi:diguanylate cyclase (GGDEF)-like protein